MTIDRLNPRIRTSPSGVSSSTNAPATNAPSTNAPSSATSTTSPRPQNQTPFSTSRFDRTAAAGATAKSGSSTSSSLGRQAGAGSAEGFGLLGRLQQATKKQLAMAAMGFALLLPPTVGQMMHPGVSPEAPVKSPVAMQIAQKSALPDGNSVRQAVQRANSQVPGGTGAAREAALQKSIGLVENAAAHAQRGQGLVSNADATMEAMKKDVGLDARMGFVVDLYWFGVPDAHHAFHAGRSDLKETARFANDLSAAVAETRGAVRGEVSKLLVAESPAYAALKADHDDVGHRLNFAKKLGSLAHRAHSELDDAKTYIQLRNMTPQTREEPVFETRTTTENGMTTSKQVQTGTRTVPNEQWSTYNMLAISAKSDAERAIRQLNTAIGEAKAVFPQHDLKNVDADLIGLFDFLGHPSFGLWSFDSADVNAAQKKVSALETSAAHLVGNLQPQFDRLDRDMNQEISARWQQLHQGPSSSSQQPTS
jgi:hypothetical protein